jgi:hypothetical protein
MTAPNGSIVFNNSTGSDTQSSGLGPSTAVYGSGASTTGSSAVVTGIDTTGVSAGDLLWVQSSSGRQFSIILSVDSSTQVTCDDQFANTESSRTWAIGGKRATWDNSDSVKIFTADAKSDWDIVTETDQTITQQITLCLGCISIRGIENGALPVIEQTSNNTLFQNGQNQSVIFHSLNFKYSHPTKDKVGFYFGYGRAVFINVVANDPNKNWSTFAARACCNPAGFFFDSCIIGNCTSDGVSASQGGGIYINSIFHDNGRYGVYSNYCTCVGCVFINNADNGLYVTGVSSLISNNMFISNGGYGLAYVLYTQGSVYSSTSNYYYNNTSGKTNQSTSGQRLESPADITLTSDPFIDSANQDYNFKDNAFINKTYWLGSDTTAYPFRKFVSSYFQTTNNTMKTHPLA